MNKIENIQNGEYKYVLNEMLNYDINQRINFKELESSFKSTNTSNSNNTLEMLIEKNIA